LGVSQSAPESVLGSGEVGSLSGSRVEVPGLDRGERVADTVGSSSDLVLGHHVLILPRERSDGEREMTK
jgi:hypothetical protein